MCYIKIGEDYNRGKAECAGILNLVEVAKELFAGRKIAGEVWITKFSDNAKIVIMKF